MSVRLKAEKPHCGARKLASSLIRRLSGDVPAKSTIRAVLDRHGLVKRGCCRATARASRLRCASGRWPVYCAALCRGCSSTPISCIALTSCSSTLARWGLGIVSKRLGSRYRSGRTSDWLKFKNPDAPAVKREAEEDWGK
jgi:hypothetical protein